MNFTRALTPGLLSCKNRGALNTGTSDGVKSITLLTATCIVVANMIGTGIFTSLGFQVGDLNTGFSILVLWFIGGVCALCGALSYAELGAALPRSGGEYHLLGAIYHPALGFLAGWVSATVGFPAPTALAAIAFGQYFVKIAPDMPSLALWNYSLPPEKYIALVIILIATLFLLRNVRLGAAFQNASTLLKVGLVLVVIGAGFFVTKIQPVSFLPASGDGRLITSGPFAVSLVYVMYAYLGWNASIYLAGEVRDPARVIPRSVILGTVIVMFLYLAVNAVFLLSTPMSEMAGKVEVGLIAGNHLFGASGAKIMAGLICAGLISTVSAMIWIGARVTMVMGEDMRLLRPFASCTKDGVPVIATLVQSGVAVVLLLSSTFSTVTTYVQFSLQICSFLVVLGVIVLRFSQPNLPRPYKTWGYPVTPLIFLFISAWMLIHIWQSNPTESRWGLGMMAVGLILYAISPPRPPAVTSLISP